jgi:hypothetical protein
VITAAIAGARLALSIFNTVQASLKNRVRLKVLPKSFKPLAANAVKRSLNTYDPGNGLCIEVVNLSAFPVTIDEVGFTQRGTKVRAMCPYPALIDDKPWPRTLEPRQSVTGYIEIENLSKKIHKAYATTACGTTRYGDSPAGLVKRCSGLSWLIRTPGIRPSRLPKAFTHFIREAITARRADLMASSSPICSEAAKFRTATLYSCSAVQ